MPNSILGVGLFVAMAVPLSFLLLRASGPLTGSVLVLATCILLAGAVAALMRQADGPIYD